MGAYCVVKEYCVFQTDSALFNLLLNIHGHAEVPKSKKKSKKSCPSAVISLNMLRFRRIKNFKVTWKASKGINFNDVFIVFYIRAKTKQQKIFFRKSVNFSISNECLNRVIFRLHQTRWKIDRFSKNFFGYFIFAQISWTIKNIIKIHMFWRLLSNLEIPIFH